MLCLKIEVLLLGFEAIETWKGFSQAFLAFQSFFVASRVGNEGRRQKVLGLASGNTSSVSAKASCRCCRIHAPTLEADELCCAARVSVPARPAEPWPWAALLATTTCVPSCSQPWCRPPHVSPHAHFLRELLSRHSGAGWNSQGHVQRWASPGGGDGEEGPEVGQGRLAGPARPGALVFSPREVGVKSLRRER